MLRHKPLSDLSNYSFQDILQREVPRYIIVKNSRKIFAETLPSYINLWILFLFPWLIIRDFYFSHKDWCKISQINFHQLALTVFCSQIIIQYNIFKMWNQFEYWKPRE